MEIEIKKRLGAFRLQVYFKSSSRRIGILGASGCGKSVTLRSIAGVERPDSGRILVDGRVMFDSERHIDIKPQKRSIGYLFQNYALFPTMTVAENIEAGIKGTNGQKKERAVQMMERFQLTELRDRLPGQLSGGQQQRTALARIMAYEPDMILLDEPFSALDDSLKERLQQELWELLSDYPGIVILVSHSRDEIYRFCRDLVIMDQGHAVCQDETETLFRAPRYVRAAQLTGCKNITAFRRLDAHHAIAPGWGLLLETKREIPADATHLGIRAHDFVPLWESGSLQIQEGRQAPVNSLLVQVKSMARLPFEDRYYLHGSAKEEEICWFLQRDMQQAVKTKGMPRWLMAPEEALLYLKERQ